MYFAPSQRVWQCPIFMAVLYLAPMAVLPVASQAQSLTCTNLQDAQTAPLRSPAGVTVMLKMHSEDDHGKNTHLCETEYTLQISRADGSVQSPVTIFRADDAWDRSLLFRIDGFSQDGNHAFFFISERYQRETQINVIDYDQLSGISKFAYLKQPHDLSPACAATLRILGTTPTGTMVLATALVNGCLQEQRWNVRANEVNGRIRPESPERLSSRIKITYHSPGSHP